MKKISAWIFAKLYAKKLREREKLLFRKKIETDALKSNCILEIENEIEPLWLAVKRDEYKLGVKTIQNIRARIHRNDTGNKETVSPNPVYSENMIAELKSKFWLYRIVIIFFCLAESFLYSLTASLFVPGGGLWMQLPIAIFFAVVIMLVLDKAFEKHFEYRDTMALHSKKEVNDAELLKYKDMRNIGYIVITLCFAAIIFAGLSRIFFLEYIPAKGLSPERISSVTRASKMASIFSLLITLITALFLAMLKREQAKIGIRFRVYQSWHKALVQNNIYTQTLINNANKLKLEVEKIVQKYWQLTIDLLRIYRMDTECDEKYEPLNKEYIQLIGRPEFLLTDPLYRRFAPIQCAHEELFIYGVMSAKEIKEKLAYVLEILKVPKEHITEHLTVFPKQKDETVHTIILPATNGKLKEN